MRLINTESLQLRSFSDPGVPAYAILSHTWCVGNESEEEITHQQWEIWGDDWSSNDALTHKLGFQKIIAACARARRDGLDWLWADTVCIDRTSSAELAEAVNSMYAWYRDADVCYVYLADVSSVKQADHPYEAIRGSRWFTRGWTLQELLAPRGMVLFFSRNWSLIGERSDMSGAISRVTTIPEEYLLGDEERLRSASVAMRMSWASRRRTSRAEDVAYCLFGLFDVNMPLLYGEGPTKAFIRLQEEIIKVSNDHTTFCWSWDESVPEDWSCMLAPSPSVFVDSRDFVRRNPSSSSTPYGVTNLGLSIRLPVIHSLTFVFAMLNAGLSQGHREARACIALRNQAYSEDNMLERYHLPETPVMLDRRYNVMHARRVFVQSRPAPSPMRQLLPPSSPNFRYGLFFTVRPKSTSLPVLNRRPGTSSLRRTATSASTSSRATARSHTSAASMSTLEMSSKLSSDLDDYIETYPPGMLDPSSGLLVLPPAGSGKTPAYAVLMRLSRADPNYCLFFAVWPMRDGRCTWYCDVCNLGSEHVFKNPRESALARGKLHREWFDQIMQFADRPIEKRAADSADGNVSVRIENESTTLHRGARINVVSIYGDAGLPVVVGGMIQDLRLNHGNDSGFFSG